MAALHTKSVSPYAYFATLIALSILGCKTDEAAPKVVPPVNESEYNVVRYADHVEIETDSAGASVALTFTGELAKRVEFGGEVGTFDNCAKTSFVIQLQPFSEYSLSVYCDDKSCHESPRHPGLFNISSASDSLEDSGTIRFYNYVGDDAVTLDITMDGLSMQPGIERDE